MSYIKQFRPLTSEDVETIRKQQGNKNIAVLLEKKPVFSEKKEINFELKIMPELNCSVEGYYILKNSLEIKDNLPFIMTQEVYDVLANVL
jgi:cell division protein YceG involved in septum cleavage